MNREESIKLLAIIKVAYPTAYKDMDDASKKATVVMWQTTFAKVPYQIMEMAFNRFRMVSKFPPTVAEMCEELKRLYCQALDEVMWASALGNKEDLSTYEWIMEHTEVYKNDAYLDMPVMAGVKALKGRVETKRLNSGEGDA
jgi:hypothetical protein